MTKIHAPIICVASLCEPRIESYLFVISTMINVGNTYYNMKVLKFLESFSILEMNTFNFIYSQTAPNRQNCLGKNETHGRIYFKKH